MMSFQSVINWQNSSGINDSISCFNLYGLSIPSYNKYISLYWGSQKRISFLFLNNITFFSDSKFSAYSNSFWISVPILHMVFHFWLRVWGMRYEVWGIRYEIWYMRYEGWGMRYEGWGMSDEVWGMRYEVWGMRYEVWGVRYEVFDMRYEIWGMRYEVWCMRVFKLRW